MRKDSAAFLGIKVKHVDATVHHNFKKFCLLGVLDYVLERMDCVLLAPIGPSSLPSIQWRFSLC